MGHFSGWAGAVALAVIVVRWWCARPRTCWLVPDSLREAAAALGPPRWR